jgi:uncharacterized Fe-S radical SAM superfamily protein PflX
MRFQDVWILYSNDDGSSTLGKLALGNEVKCCMEERPQWVIELTGIARVLSYMNPYNNKPHTLY